MASLSLELLTREPLRNPTEVSSVSWFAELLKNPEIMALAQEIQKRKQLAKPLLVTVAGRSGSGKSSIVEGLRRFYFPNSALIELDNYARGNPWVIDQRARGKVMNWDHPEYFEIQQCAKHIAEIKKGKLVRVPQFDFRSGTRTNSVKRVAASEIVFLEGLHALHPTLLELADVRVFIELQSRDALQRRLKRDVTRTTMIPKEIEEYYLTQAEPMFDQFVLPQKQFADFVIENHSIGIHSSL